MGEQPGGRAQAAALYRRALDVDPSDVDVLYNLAVELSKTSCGHEEAAALYRQILLVRPDDSDTLHNLALVDKGQAAQTRVVP